MTHPWSARPHILKQRTHCPKGHAYTLENTYRLDDGCRRCVQCRRDSVKANYWRRKAMA